MSYEITGNEKSRIAPRRTLWLSRLHAINNKFEIIDGPPGARGTQINAAVSVVRERA